MNWLRQRRKELNLKQEDLAARLQLDGLSFTHSAISHWETGRYHPPFEDEKFRQALADILRMDVSSMLRLAGYEVGLRPYSERAERAAFIVDNLPDDKQDLALRILAELAKEFSSS
jgi:transcriptional regulator with XRE-family HTH domain